MRGGARQGAGRKRTDNKQVGLRLSPACLQRLDEIADKYNMTNSQAVMVLGLFVYLGR